MSHESCILSHATCSLYFNFRIDQWNYGLECLNFVGKQLAIAKKVTTFDRANSMRTCNPSFIAVMRPSYIDAACNLVSCKQRFCLKVITFFNGWGSFLFWVLTLRFLGEGAPGNLEFGCEVSRVWPRIIPPRNQTRVLPNDSSLKNNNNNDQIFPIK